MLTAALRERGAVHGTRCQLYMVNRWLETPTTHRRGGEIYNTGGETQKLKSPTCTATKNSVSALIQAIKDCVDDVIMGEYPDNIKACGRL